MRSSGMNYSFLVRRFASRSTQQRRSFDGGAAAGAKARAPPSLRSFKETVFDDLIKQWLRPLPVFGSLVVLSFILNNSKRKEKNEEAEKAGSKEGEQYGGLFLYLLGLKLKGGSKQEIRHFISFVSLGERILSYKTYAEQISVPPKPASSPAPPSASTPASASSAQPKPAVYVLKFKGDIQASQVKDLREEITAILEIAVPGKGDEVVLLLTSGGGTVSGYGSATAQLLRLVSAGLNLTVCVDEIAASGGYMMAAAANKEIIASPFALIGSIGVVSTMPNVTKLLDSLGIEVEDVTAGQYKRTMVPYKLSTPESRQKVQEDVDVYHAAFQEHLRKCRGKRGLDAAKVATGATWFGDAALNLKLVDRLGTSDELLLSHLKAGKDVFFVQHRLERRGVLGDWTSVDPGDALSFVDTAVQSLAKAVAKLASTPN